ncbi:MAG: hypothetical protein QM697_02075 [Lachnospiraceae bacterium]
MKILVFLLLGISSYTDLKKRVISMRVLLFFLSITLLGIALVRLPQLGKLFGLPWLSANKAAIWLEKNFCCRLSMGSIIGGLLPGIVLLLCSKLLKGAVGEGDAYLIMLTGLMLGRENNLLLLGGLLLSAGCAAFLLLVRQKEKKTTIPFVPFLFLSDILIFFIMPAAEWSVPL